MLKKLYIVGLLQALGVTIYCFIISSLFRFFESSSIEPPSFLGPAFMLLLLVFSAAVTGGLVFGYPVYLAMNKEIKKALQVLAYTLFFCLLFVVIIFLSIVAIS